MNKTRILLCSLLKPINDTRMFEKLGLSLQKLPQTEVHIAGFKAAVPEAPANIFFHPLFCFSRLSIGRITAQYKYFKLLLKLKPHIIIIGTHELLLTSLVCKLFVSCKLIYDVQENYYLNLISQKIYPRLIRNILANGIRAIEKIAAPFISTFFLAEKSYAQELPFVQGKSIILENKFKPTTPRTLSNTSAGKTFPTAGPIQMLYSGTISELNGIYEAIDFCESLNQVSDNFGLTIIGSWTQPETGNKVRNLIKDKPYITLIGGDELVPHHNIIEAIQTSQIGLLPYRPNVSTSHCIPTKLFEYLANTLPVVSQQNPYWDDIFKTHHAGLIIDFNNFSATEVILALSNMHFYNQANLTDFFWETEEKKLLSYLQLTISALSR